MNQEFRILPKWQNSRFIDYFDSLTLENLLNELMIHKVMIRKFEITDNMKNWKDDLAYIEKRLVELNQGVLLS